MPASAAERISIATGGTGGLFYVIGAGMTPFGKYMDKNMKTIAADAVNRALEHAGITKEQLQVAVVGNAYQGLVNNHFNTKFNTPIVFFTQLVGLAFGQRPTLLGLGKEIVPAEPVILARLEVETEEGEAAKRRLASKGGLPMPRMD